MPRVVFTKNLQRHVPCPPVDAPGSTVCDVLGNVFANNPRLRGYVVDEHGALRKHMTVFINNDQIKDRLHLSDPVEPSAEIFVMQALSGG